MFRQCGILLCRALWCGVRCRFNHFHVSSRPQWLPHSLDFFTQDTFHSLFGDLLHDILTAS